MSTFWENNIDTSQKNLRIYLLYDIEILLLSIYQRTKNSIKKRYLHLYVHASLSTVVKIDK